ncbi:deoxyhypusine synthase family protein [Candidatus Micrarchaeota archaeon]|nr:deoxyhypusine synthase family protein [Candidatus Micrarchaeota archaeon]
MRCGNPDISDSQINKRKHEELATGYSDGYEPLEALDLSKVKTVNDLVTRMGKCSFGARNIGEAADVLEAMVKDKDCFKVLTLSGAMTAAKMGLVICDMIDDGMIDAVVSTGALMAHGFVESVGMRHFKYRWDMKDEELYEKGYDRIYDTLELEHNLDEVAEIVNKVLDKADPKDTLSSFKINQMLGRFLAQNTKGRGILKSAYEKKVPVYVPAFTDSEVGLDVALHNRRRKIEGQPTLNFNPFVDLEDFTERVRNAKKIGIFTIGGGVPRNWAQQGACYLDLINSRIGSGGDFKRYNYAVRICPEPVHWGGLSGCTYSESVSWGKVVPKSEGGKFVEVFDDATIAWPMIVKAVQERLEIRK